MIQRQPPPRSHSRREKGRWLSPEVMKRFDIITEADARTLRFFVSPPEGWSLALDTVSGGQVPSPLAVSPDGRRIAFVARKRDSDTPLGSDHTGLALKRALVEHLRGRGIAVIDVGTDTPDPVDYPDIAGSVARSVARGEADAGIVIDGAGIGSAIAANKVRGIRAAMCVTETIARYSREHNGANVITLGSSLVDGPDTAIRIVGVWLGTAMREARYIRRLLKIRRLEDNFGGD